MLVKERIAELEKELKYEEEKLVRLGKEGKSWTEKSVKQSNFRIDEIKERITKAHLLYLENLKYLKNISDSLIEILNLLIEK